MARNGAPNSFIGFKYTECLHLLVQDDICLCADDGQIRTLHGVRLEQIAHARQNRRESSRFVSAQRKKF